MQRFGFVPEPVDVDVDERPASFWHTLRSRRWPSGLCQPAKDIELLFDWVVVNQNGSLLKTFDVPQLKLNLKPTRDRNSASSFARRTTYSRRLRLFIRSSDLHVRLGGFVQITKLTQHTSR